jgi:hypothetical protein
VGSAAARAVADRRCRRSGRGFCRRCRLTSTPFVGVVGPSCSGSPSECGGQRHYRPKRLANCSSQTHGCLQRNSFTRLRGASYVKSDAIQVSSPTERQTPLPTPLPRRKSAWPLARLNL